MSFAVDLLVMFLPLLLFLGGLGLAFGLGAGRGGRDLARCGILAGHNAWLAYVGLPLVGLGLGMLAKTILVYRGDYFAPLSVSGLLHKVKVSNVRPVPARLRGTIIGRGVPGLIWSEDFVMRDSTGILFLDYRQPLRIWEWLFGLFRAGEFRRQGSRGRRLVPARAGTLSRAQIDHGRRRDSKQLRPPRSLRLGSVARRGWRQVWPSPASSAVDNRCAGARPLAAAIEGGGCRPF